MPDNAELSTELASRESSMGCETAYLLGLDMLYAYMLAIRDTNSTPSLPRQADSLPLEHAERIDARSGQCHRPRPTHLPWKSNSQKIWELSMQRLLADLLPPKKVILLLLFARPGCNFSALEDAPYPFCLD